MLRGSINLKFKIIAGILLAVISLYKLTDFTFQYRNQIEKKSYFSELISQNGGQIPFPFEKLLNHIFSNVALTKDDQLQFVLVPKGRSLQRNNADFKNPRIITAMGDQFPIFMGYAPKTDQVEIISFNPHSEQYDFHVVTDYKSGGHPKLTTPNREMCLQCHQHGGPIFSRSPWREMRERRTGTEEAFFKKFGYTNEIPSHDIDENLVASAILSARKNQSLYNGMDLKNYASEKTGYKGHLTRGPAASYAFYLRLANWSLQMHQVANAACEGDLDCRALVLKSALLFPSIRLNLITKGAKETLPVMNAHIKALENAVKKHWPSNGFSYVSPVIPDKKVLSLKNGESRGYVIRPLVDGQDVTYLEMLGDYIPSEFYYLANHQLVDLKKISWTSFHEQEIADAKILDPKSPRPFVRQIPLSEAGEFLLTNGLEGLNFSRNDDNILRTLDYEKLLSILNKDSKYNQFVQQWPPDTNKVLASILIDMNRTKDAELISSLPQKTQNLL